jgi:4-aminobutyrate aminotransferase
MPSWLSLFYDEPIELVSGQGRRVVDGEGNEYLDFFGGILVTSAGHAVPEIVDAIRTQAGKMLHSSTLYLIRPMVELAERMAALSGIEGAKVFLTNSGTEANDAALMLCCTAARSNQVLALRNSYHGRSFGSMGVTGIRSWSSTSLTPLNVSYVYGGDRLRGPFADRDDATISAAAAADLRDVIETTTAGQVACMIAEPIQGVGGFVTPPDGFFAALKAVLDEYGIPFVCDEVQTGWGRTGEHFWGYQAHGIVPDLLTVAKGMGNGLAIGGVIGRPQIMEAVHANSISTFGGNPLASAGALATIEYLLSHDLQANALRIGNHLRAGLRPLVDKLAVVADVRGKGLMLAVELVEPGTLTPSPVAAGLAMEETRRRGLLVGKGGARGNVLRLAPPLSVTAQEADEGLEILVEALVSVDQAMSEGAG